MVVAYLIIYEIRVTWLTQPQYHGRIDTYLYVLVIVSGSGLMIPIRGLFPDDLGASYSVCIFVLPQPGIFFVDGLLNGHAGRHLNISYRHLVWIIFFGPVLPFPVSRRIVPVGLSFGVIISLILFANNLIGVVKHPFLEQYQVLGIEIRLFIINHDHERDLYFRLGQGLNDDRWKQHCHFQLIDISIHAYFIEDIIHHLFSPGIEVIKIFLQIRRIERQQGILIAVFHTAGIRLQQFEDFRIRREGFFRGIFGIPFRLLLSIYRSSSSR